MPSEEFERHIKSKMDNLSHPPSPAVWKGLEQRLSEQRKNAYLFRWIVFGIGGLCLLTFLATYRFNHRFPSSQMALSPLLPHITYADSCKPESFTSSSLQKKGNQVAAGLNTASIRINRIPWTPVSISSPIHVPKSPPIEEGLTFYAPKHMDTRSISLETQWNSGTIFSLEVEHVHTPKWWLELYGGWGSADNRGFAQLSQEGSLFQAGNTRVDYSEVEGWNLNNPFSPVDRPLPVLRISYPRVNQFLGMGLSYEFRQKWALAVGARYFSSRDGRIEVGRLPSDFVPEGAVEAADLPIEDFQSYKFTQSQLEIPVQVGFSLIDKGRHQWVLGLGPSLNFNLESNRHFEQIAEETPFIDAFELPRYQAWNALMSYRVDYEYQISKGLRFSAGPVFTHQLTGAFSGASSPEQMRYRLGLRTGLSWKLGP